MINTIILGHALNVLPQLPAESVNCCVCSPPYWSLRDYGIEPVIWDGDGEFYSESLKRYIPRDCKHDFSIETKVGDIRFRGKNSIVGSERNPKVWEGDGKGQFCRKCGAFRGSLGLEPTFELYIKHLCDIFDEVKRVLRKDGTCWVNIGDSYSGSNCGSNDYRAKDGLGAIPQERYKGQKPGKTNLPSKSLCDIPYRFSIEMINRGWIKRNTIIWHKPNCMPSSADDRFTVDFEYLFFFTKNNKALFWTNEKTLECVDKNPMGIKGIEGKDWEWRECTNCQGEGTIVGKALKEGAAPIIIGNGIVTKNTKTFRTCPHCKGSGKVKYSLWTGHDYWFEQQFEELKEETKKDKRTINGYKNIRGRSWDKDPNSMFGKMGSMKVNPQGRNKRCVWTIPTQPFPEAHFAVYPEGLIEIPIKAGCPEFVCKKCGKARVKIYERQIDFRTEKSDTKYIGLNAGSLAEKRQAYRKLGYESPPRPKEIGYSDCGCNAGWEGGIVLDLFMGSGTTALVALKQRKRFIGIEIKQEYIDMSYKRIAKVQQEIF